MNTKLIFLFILFSQTVFGQFRTFSGKSISNKKFDTLIGKAMDSLGVHGMSIAVINNGKIVYCKGYGFSNVAQSERVDNRTFFEAASLSKPVFASFVLTLANENKIDLNKPLYEYLPPTNMIDERYKKINAAMVLSHTTGLPNWSESDTINFLYNPGEKFSYSGEAYTYLAKVIAKQNNLTLETLDNYFQSELAKKFGLKDFHFILTPTIKNKLATGYQDSSVVYDDRDRNRFDSAGGLYANASTYAKFLTQLMKREDLFNDMFVPRIDLESNDIVKEIFGIEAWTSGLAVIKIKNSVNFWHGGNNLGFTSSFMINPEKKFGYVFFTNADQCNGMKKILEDILWQ
ncbi:serine hydrolase domain-containing protein [Epilithonimonas arachidiradicis]|uniref:CubicO group peptidase (Beta-lactamase class C family) n=2 Tax=Epilithonimonas arachidiradicis TaxID=1617282 RepID=A0A420DEX0_9FLAO|nr:serine hydrolase domain-containing protein [Epilithonimonas arachidiradicis]RKE90109.1 CubicO group peptidase (beta-lactamase class C family) [Epilithonimonas arachidiradicis]